MSTSTARPEPRRLARAAGALVLAGGLMAFAAEVLLHPVRSLDVAAVLATAASVGVMALLRLAGRSRLAQAALMLWTASLLLELAVVVAPGGRVGGDAGAGTSAGAGWVSGTVWALLLVTGPLVAGSAIGRAGVLTGWRRWVPLAFGLVQSLEFLPLVLGLTVTTQAVIDGLADAILPVITLLLAVALLTAFRPSGWIDRWRRSAVALGTR